MTPPAAGRAVVVGTGLIGGSIGLALRARGWHVSGTDRTAQVADRALALGALDRVGPDAEADITFVATPVGASSTRWPRRWPQAPAWSPTWAA